MLRWMIAIVGWLSALILLGAGAAQSLSGSDTVFSDDIVNGQVTNADIKPGSLGLSRLKAAWTAPVRVNVGINVSGFTFAPCPAGQTAISGSANAGSTSANVISSIPQADGWFVSYRNWGNAETWIEAAALCVKK